MKTKNLIAALLITVTFAACSHKTSSDVKPQTTAVDGYLNGYFEIADGSYKIEDNNENAWIIKVKVKAIKPMTAKNLGFDNYCPFSLSFVDDKGAPLTGFDNFQTTFTNNDMDKLSSILKQGSGETWISFSEIMGESTLYLPKNISMFNISSHWMTDSTATTGKESSDKSTASDDKTSDEDWDKLIADYKDYMNQYIDLMKKANDGDESAMTQYPEMLDKANQVATDIQNAGSKVSATQMSKFLKMETELMAKAAKIEKKTKS